MQVKESRNYEMFRSIDGNRPMNTLHLNRLKKSMEQDYLVSPIIVNEKFQIIDGQHRVKIASDLGLPIRYIQIDGYGLDEVHRLNQNSKNWTNQEFVDGYAGMGYKDYQYLLDFVSDHDVTLTIAISLLSSNNGDQYMKIKNGTWKVINKERGNTIAEWIQILKPYYDGTARKTFVLALQQLYENRDFEFSQLISKVTLQPMALVHCVNSNQYLSLIESIYNYHSRNKVNLRF